MPLVTNDEAFTEGERGSLPTPQPEGERPSALDVLAAAERTSNVAGMLYDRFSNPKPDVKAVKGFDPLTSIPKGFETYADRFLDAESPAEVDWIKGRIQAEQADRETIRRAGGWGVAATIAAGQTDPITIASMAIPGAGATRLASALRVAGANAASTAAQEFIAHQTSPTRTLEDSLTNVGAGAILGGILGAAITPRVPAAELERLRTNFDTAVNPNISSTVGAAAAAKSTLAENSIAGPGNAIASSVVGQVSPGLRLLTSPSSEARELIQHLAETREVLNKNLEGIATPTAIETSLRRQEGTWWEAWKARGEEFRAYRERIAGTDEVPLSRREFNAEIAYAMRRGDQSSIPEVSNAATKTRAIVFEPLKQRAQALGLLERDTETTGADSYLLRQYDAKKIRQNMGPWIDTLTEGFVEQGVDRTEARDIAYKATRNVLGSERGTMDWRVLDDVVPQSGRLKERTLKLPDSVLEPYLNSDIDHLTHSYLRSLAPEVEFTERFGSRDLKQQLDAVRDEYSVLMEQARSRGDGNAIASLDARRDADIRDLTAIRDRLYGIYGQPKDPGSFFVRAARLARQGNALRLLGAATLAHFPDIANVITRYGLPNTFSALAKLGTSLEALQLTRQQARRIGVGLDMVMNTTAALLGDYGSHSQFFEQRLASRLTRGFTIMTGETPLISMVQSLASVIGQDELLRNAERVAVGQKLTKAQLTRLAAAGMNESMLRRIATEGTTHGQEVNGLRFGMSENWTDKAAAQAFETAILKDAHAMTLSPGVGDTPLLMSSEIGKTVQQFRSFAFAASRHVVMPLAQGIAAGDVRAMTGLMALVASGYLTYWTKQKAAGMPVETDHAGRLALEVLDKSNLMGWMSEVIYPGLWSLGLKDFSRWSDRDAVETIGGPTAGTLANIYERRLPAKLLGDQQDPGHTLTRSDLHFIRRLLPAQNLWYARRAISGLEDSVGDLFDLPGMSQKDRGELNAATE